MRHHLILLAVPMTIGCSGQPDKHAGAAGKADCIYDGELVSEGEPLGPYSCKEGLWVPAAELCRSDASGAALPDGVLYAIGQVQVRDDGVATTCLGDDRWEPACRVGALPVPSRGLVGSELCYQGHLHGQSGMCELEGSQFVPDCALDQERQRWCNDSEWHWEREAPSRCADREPVAADLEE